MKWVDKRQSDKIEVCFRASKAVKKRIVGVVTRTHPSVGDEKGEGGGGGGALEILLDLIGMHPDLDTTTPLMQSVRMEDHDAVRSDTSVMVVGKLRRKRALAVRTTLEDMRRLTLGSARGVGTADSSRALEVVGCYGVRYSRG